MTQLNTNANELKTDELDSVSGGFIWIPVVVGSFLLGTGIRMGLDKIIEQVKK